ncbi:MAG TPA: hypothetical protein VGK79_02245 [Gaiellaceae bacterium]
MRLDQRILALSVIGLTLLAAASAGAAPPSTPPGAAKAHAEAATTEAAPPPPAKTHGSSAAKQAAATPAATSRSACAGAAAFSQFGDDNRYSLLTNGTLETGGPARRAGKPKIALGNETFFLHAAGDQRSLPLRGGDSVAFHAACLPRLNPVFRFVARAGAGDGILKLQVQYGPAKRLHAQTLGTLTSADYADWAATPALPFLNGAARLVDQVKGNVWLVLTATGSATWQVDDLYIDPYVNK